MARTQPQLKKPKKDRKQLDSSDEEDKGLEIDEKNSAPAVVTPKRKIKRSDTSSSPQQPQTSSGGALSTNAPNGDEVIYSLNPYINDLLAPFDPLKRLYDSLTESKTSLEPEFDQFLELVYGEDPYHTSFQVLTSRRENLENVVMQLIGCNGEQWGDHASKVVELYKAAAGYAAQNWGKDTPATNNLAVDWNIKHLQDLLSLTVMQTQGFKWKDLQLCQTEIIRMHTEISKLRKEAKHYVNNEFAHQLGVTLGDFASKWRSLSQTVEELKEENNAPVSPKHSPSSPEVF